MKAHALGLDGSYLFLQGPPGPERRGRARGSSRTSSRPRQRVGIAAKSHKAIHNLLSEIERVARDTGVRFKGLKKSSAGNPESEFNGDYIRSEADNSAFANAPPASSSSRERRGSSPAPSWTARSTTS